MESVGPENRRKNRAEAVSEISNNAADELADAPKPFLSHLEELRWTLARCLAALALGMLACLPAAPRIFKWLCAPLAGVTERPDLFLRSLEITGAFSIALKIVFWSGLILSAPFLLFFIGSFVFPGLTARERRMARAAVAAGACLFIFGVGMGYFITLPIALRIFFGIHAWLGIQAEWTAPSYVAFSMQLLLLFGLAFEVPVVIAALGYCGVVSAADLAAKRRHAIVGILVLAMVLTPGPDVVSQLLMAIPMYVLYEACVLAIRFFERRRDTASAGRLAIK